MPVSDHWQELGDGIFRRRYEFLDQNVGLVTGGEAVLVIDTRSHPAHGEELLSDVRHLTPLPIGWVFNTHYHWDHTFGNQVFASSALWGHANCRSEMTERGLSRLDELLVDYPEEAESFRMVVVTPPTEVFEDRATIDLGNRIVELSYHGRGHTNSDAVLHVDGVTFAGDLIEQGGPPSFGDSFPISWFDTVGRLAAEARATVVPGHGDVVDVEFLVVSRFDLGWIGRRAREGLAKGLAVSEVDLKDSPFPEFAAREALERAYLELGGSDSSSVAKFSQ